MIPRKLTPGEITAVVEKIRKKYEEYIYKYFKSKSLREAFEERYLRSLRASVDVSSFLLAEIGAIEELIKREEDRIVLPPPSEPRPDIADKVIEENRKRIVKYRDSGFHPDASEDARRLLGALQQIAEDHWPALTSALRETASNMNSLEMLNLDSQLRYLSAPGRDGVPQFLARYTGQLKRFPRNYAAIDREDKEFILEAAFFLNDLLSILERVRRVYKDLNAQAKESLGAAIDFTWGVIGDFRLKDLKRRKTRNAAEER
ncbi:MAG: hypothetical protein NTU62_18945 [Spirochaetes bacterium]|nr:hypothetical protein [Spirochaetota bacterium]